MKLIQNKDAFDFSFSKKLFVFERIVVKPRQITFLLACLFFCGCRSTPEPEKPHWEPPTEDVSARSHDPEECRTGEACLKQAKAARQRHDTEQMLYYLGRTCDFDVDFCGSYVNELLKAEKKVEARQVLQKLCVQESHVIACGQAGRYFITEEPVDQELGERYLRRSCDQGNIEACYNLGVAYERGFLPGSREDMIALYKQGCDAKFEEACQNLAIVYIREDSPESEAKAVALFEASCARGYPDACTDLADRLFAGRGVKQDQERAISLLERVCEKDHAYGCAFYAKALYRSSAPGDRERRLRAIEISQKSCAMGSPRGCLWAGEFAEEVEDSLDNTAIETLYLRAFAIFDKDCQVVRTGRSCGMCATILEKHLEESPSGLDANRYYALGCEYDKRVCDWR